MSRPTAPTNGHDSLHGKKPETDVSIDVPLLKRLSSSHIAELASELAHEEVAPTEPALLELTARHPCGELGNLDVYMPGRWDTTSDLIFMDTVVQTGPSEWTGSAAYIAFHPAEPATYLIVGHFTGHEITMHLTGPWGENTAYTPTMYDAGAVVALWTGGEASFGMHCTDNNEYSLGYIESVQVFRLS
ncbi:MAG TPA: hypothetical protein VF094_03095 [Gaiellaceae bacterium]